MCFFRIFIKSWTGFHTRRFIFSLHVENALLLDDVKLDEAVSAFLHFCFVCILHYPKEAGTLGDILQHMVAEYGDDTGT